MALLPNLKTLPHLVFVFLLLGLTLRIVFIVVHQRPLISDERDYNQLAVTLSTTGLYAYDGVPTAYRPIAYPATVALIYLVSGEQPIVVKLIQALIDTFTALLLYLILKTKSERIKTAALAIWCFFIPAILYSNFLLTETIFTFLLVLSCYVVIRTTIEARKSAVLIGLLLGLLTLMKPGMVLFIVLFSVFVYVVGIPRTKYKFIVAGALIVLAPWLVRNYLSLGKLTLGTNGGINLLIGNNPNTTGAYTINYPEEILELSVNEVQADETAYRYATKYILEHPATFIINGVKKLAHLLSSEGGLLVLAFHEDPEDFTERYAIKYAAIPLPYVLIVNASYMLILIVGVLGFLAAPKDVLWWFVLILIACWLVTHFVFFGGSRYHFPIMPFLVVYASQVIPDITSAFRGLTAPQKLIFMLLTVFFISVWAGEFTIVYNVQ